MYKGAVTAKLSSGGILCSVKRLVIASRRDARLELRVFFLFFFRAALMAEEEVEM